MTTRHRRLVLAGSGLLAPAFLYILLIVIYPLLYAVWVVVKTILFGRGT